MKLYQHKVFTDDRGTFSPLPLNTLGETWDQCSIVTNPKRFTFRGLHYQTNPQQKKYVKVVTGSIIDFEVDLKTLQAKWQKVDADSAVEIDEDKAHGYLTLEPNTTVVYLVKGEYNPESEHSIVWTRSPDVKRIVESYIIKHPLIISEKDTKGK